MADADSAGRNSRHAVGISLFSFQGCQTAVDSLVGRRNYGISCQSRTGKHETASRGIRDRSFSGSFQVLDLAWTAAEADSSLTAYTNTIHAGNTARRVDTIIDRVDTLRFAVAAARAAAVAFRCVDHRFKKRITGKES